MTSKKQQFTIYMLASVPAAVCVASDVDSQSEGLRACMLVGVLDI
jgi:hypothetical protein